jgi:hypothetical protein
MPAAAAAVLLLVELLAQVVLAVVVMEVLLLLVEMQLQTQVVEAVEVVEFQGEDLLVEQVAPA